MDNIESDPDYDTELLDSINGSFDDDCANKSKFPKYNPAEMSRDYKFVLGMEFNSIDQFKEAIKEYSLLNGRDVSRVGNSLTYGLKTYKGQHTCGRNFKGYLASSKWIASKLVETMKPDEKIKLSHVIQNVKEKYMAKISVTKAYWARRKAMEKLQGITVEQYNRIWDYCEEVRNSNPGSTLKVMVDRPSLNHQPVFQRLYMCIDAIKRGFLAGCRPIIGLDGFHLKGPYGQQLLVAVARDPNNNYFPIAIAFLESETKDFWGWFMTLLLEDIGAISEKRWIFISDQQKGLVQVFAKMLEGVEHGFCVRHLYANCKKTYGGGSVLRNLILAAAKVPYVQEWERKMKELQRVKKECHDTLMGLDPALWTRSHFTFHAKSDMLMNNISESFNGRILEARDKPILTMLEWIRCYLMFRFTEKRLKAERYKGKINPKPRKRLDHEVVHSREWIAKWARGMKFEVSHNNRYIHEKFIVDLEAGSCSCRFWGLTGLPCQHACSAIFFKGDDPEDYISNYYSVEAYKACYASIVNPINGENMKPVLNKQIAPLTFRAKPGRPKKLRREVDEPPPQHKFRRNHTSVTCGKCNSYGHNKRTCKNQPPSTNQTDIPT